MDSVDKAIDELKAKMDEHLQAVAKIKSAINTLSDVAGRPMPYEDVNDAANTVAAARKKTVEFKADEFFSKPLATCVKMVLQARATADLGPAKLEEIYAVMKKGGYHFEAKDEMDAMRGLGVSISKNSNLFVRLPANGLIGLVEWYPNLKRKRKADDGDEAGAEQANDSGSGAAADAQGGPG